MRILLSSNQVVLITQIIPLRAQQVCGEKDLFLVLLLTLLGGVDLGRLVYLVYVL